MVAQKEALCPIPQRPLDFLQKTGLDIKNEPRIVSLPDGLEIDLENRNAINNGRPADRFTRREWAVLNYLAINVNNAIPRHELIESADLLSGAELRTYVRTIRAKLGIREDGPLKNVRGFGYMIDDGTENPADIIKAGSGIEVNVGKRQVKKDGEAVVMALQEYRLIELLVLCMGEVVPNEDLIQHIFLGNGYNMRNLKTVLHNARRKLDISRNGPIRAIHNSGLMLLTPEMEEAEKFGSKYS